MIARVVLTNLGSLGNVQPFLALANELREHGYVPVLALAPRYRDYVEGLGFEFEPIGFDLDYAALQRKDTQAERNGVSPLLMLRDSLGVFAPMMPQMFDELSSICHSADLLISGHLQPVARMVHELTDIPFVSVHTNHFGQEQPREFRQALCEVINPFRHQLGLPPIADPVHLDANSPQLALYAISKYLRPPSVNWLPHYHTTGFFYLDDKAWVAPNELVQFLESGEQPVFVGFSSIAHDNPAAVTQLIVDVIQDVGCRGIIQSGWSGLAEGVKLPPRIFRADFVQHSWLFPRTSCIVHAGGSGNTAAALRVGKPSIVVPHVGDQPIWAELAKGLGCSKYTIPYGELTRASLAEALSATLSDASLLQTSSSIGYTIRAEDGVQYARRLITDLLVSLGIISADARDAIDLPITY